MSEERGLTPAEVAMAASIFGNAVDYARVRIRNRKWAFFQPSNVTMAPMGHIHFHPYGQLYRADFHDAPPSAQGLFIHEMTHVWQAQLRGRWWLPLMRHPFCRYRYTLVPGRRLEDYGIEQQAEIVRHAFMARSGRPVPGAPDPAALERLLPFA